MGIALDKFALCGGDLSDNKSDDGSYQGIDRGKHETRRDNGSQRHEQTSERQSNRHQTSERQSNRHQTSQHQSNRRNSKTDSEKFATSMRLRGETDGFLGYHFNDEGVLCDENGLRFGQQGAKTVDQDDFSILATNIMELVQENLVSIYDLEKITVPVDAAPGEPQSFIFASKNAQTTTGKLLILIHGSGNVVAGIWSKKVIMYDNLYKGSQLPYVEEAINDDYEVVVLNTNVNSRTTEVDSWKGRAQIRGSSNPVEHVLYVWDNFIFKCKAQHIAIVAHSYGGIVTTELAIRRKDNFLKRVFAVAFTDSVHRLDHKQTQPEVVKFFCDNARNWVTSDKVLDTQIGKNEKKPLSDAPRVSAGDSRHEWTSHAAFRSVFAFFDQKFRSRCSETEKQTVATNSTARTVDS